MEAPIPRTRRSRRREDPPDPTSHVDPAPERPPDRRPDRPPEREPDEMHDPWPIDGFPEPPPDCDCEPEPPAGRRPERPPRIPPRDDCCDRIIDTLRCIQEGGGERCFLIPKPKTPPKVKIANACGSLPVKERLAPILMLFLRRFLWRR